MYTDDQIIEEIRRIAAALGKKSLTLAEFKKHGSISDSTVSNKFGSWNNAVQKAGLEPINRLDGGKRAKRTLTLSKEELLLDLVRLYNDTGKQPTKALINSKGKYSDYPYRKNWGSHKEAFLIAKSRFPEKFGSSSITPDISSTTAKKIKIVPEMIKPKISKNRRIVFGEPINFRGLRFAPINEQGVVYLFGMISHELGYLIESVRTEFPDCEGKRCFDKQKKRWEHVNIEFEYKSSNFKEHGHNEKECDIIVCWEHDWDESPIEVLELRSVINYLPDGSQ